MPACTRCGADLPDDARFCPSCGAPVEAPASAEERKLATVLFADLVGSTALAGGQDPERTRAMLDRFYEAMADEIGRAGGTVEKFAGDAVMAAFGAPAAHEDHAERALHTALSMQRRLAELFGDELRLRIGVNTGDVVVGRPREGSSWVSGDPVNVAARLEQAAAPDEILVGERTVTAARGAFEFGEETVVEAKGKPGGVACRRLVRALSLMRPRGVGGLREAFVGRDTELELLRATYSRAVERGEPHLVTIMGDAGVGKTRLVRELWRWLADRSPQPFQRTGRVLAYGNVPYWALGEMLKEHLGILESDPPETTLGRLGDRQILGLALGLDVARELHPLAARDRLHDSWLELVEELARERPTVLLVEDIHWADDLLLDLIERIARDARGPLLLLATARPEILERRPAWGGGRRNASLVWLDALTADEAGRMLHDLLAADLPDGVRDLVVERAEGNPFFVEELLGSLIDRGIVVRSGERWEVGELPAGYEVPDSVQAILAARIDLLGAREKAALQAAAVIGRAFWTGPVRVLVGGADPDWTTLEDRDFVRRRPSSSMAGEDEYAFKHALTREVAYASLTKARRAQLHAAMGSWVEQLGRDELAPLLAHHYAEAVRPEDADLAWAGQTAELAKLRERALEWSLRAADRAARRYELAEAQTLLARALPLAETPAERVEVLRRQGLAHALNFAGEPFWTAMQAAIEEADDDVVRSELYADIAFESALRSGIWQRMPARETVDTWVDRALAAAPADSPARVKALIARARWNPTTGGAAAVEASRIAEKLGDPVLRSAAWDGLGIAAFVSGRFEDGRAWAERRFELLDQISDPDMRADIHAAPISGCIWSGRFGEARRLAKAHDEIASRLTPHHRLHGVAIEIEVEELLGGWDQVRDLQPRMLEAVDDNLETPCVRNARSLLVSAVAQELAGNAGDASALEARALELWMEGYGHTLETPRVRLALARGDLGEVERSLTSPDTAHGWHRGWFVFANVAARLDALAALGDAQAIEAEAPQYVRRRNYLRPFSLRALARARSDEAMLAEAIGEFESLGLAWHAEETRRLLAG